MVRSHTVAQGCRKDNRETGCHQILSLILFTSLKVEWVILEKDCRYFHLFFFTMQLHVSFPFPSSCARAQTPPVFPKVHRLLFLIVTFLTAGLRSKVSWEVCTHRNPERFIGDLGGAVMRRRNWQYQSQIYRQKWIVFNPILMQWDPNSIKNIIFCNDFLQLKSGL